MQAYLKQEEKDWSSARVQTTCGTGSILVGREGGMQSDWVDFIGR